MRGAAPIFTAVMLAAFVAGCAGRIAVSPPETRPPQLDRITAEELANDLARGRHTKAEVQSRLGDAIVVRFDSGYEVWVYRITEAASATRQAERAKPGTTERDATGELVILLAPSGEVAKVRTRVAQTSDQRSE